LTVRVRGVSETDPVQHDTSELVALQAKLIQTEEALRMTRSELNHVFDTVTHGIRIINKDYTVRFINKTFAELSGISAEEALGRKCYEVFPSSFCHTAECRLARVISGEELVRTETERKTADGTSIPCVISVFPFHGPDGELVGVIETFRDISLRKKMQAELLESEERYGALINLGTEVGEAVVMLQDMDGKEAVQTFVSDEWPRITGYTRDELLGMSFFELVKPAECQDSMKRHRLKISGVALPGLFELTIVRKDGTEMPVELTSAFTNYQGQRANVAYIRDITQRRQAEQALRDSEKLYRTLFENTGTATCLAEEDMTITLVNSEYEKLSGYSKAEIEGKKKWPEFVASADLARSMEFSRQLRSGSPQTPNSFEVGFLDRNRHVKNVILTVDRIPGSDRRIASIKDITRRKQAEKALRKSRQRIRDLLGHVEKVREEERKRIAAEIHDELGQLLTAMKMDVVWLAKRIPADQNLMLDKAQSMRQLVDMTIQSVKRISAELRPHVLDNLGLVAAIDWQVTQIKEVTDIDCRFTSTLADDATDQDTSVALFRIFQEAVTNAIRHARASKIKIELKKKREQVVLSVQDNGRGIKHSEITDAKSFGLIGIKERAHALGGEVDIVGRPNRGTVVTATIPMKMKGVAHGKNTHRRRPSRSAYRAQRGAG